jgi:hypothetical protein
MPSKGTFYGIVAVMVAFILFSSAFALLYYGQYQQEASQNQQHVNELDSTLRRYTTLAKNYDSGLSDLNTSLSLLTSAISNLNTSSAAYVRASDQISALWNSYQELAKVNGNKVLTYGVRMLIDYGNGTSKWYNDTSIQPGWNAYVVSVVIFNGRVQSTWYPSYGEHLIEGINGVASGQSDSWFLWTGQKGGWEVSQMGADALQVYNGTVVAWTLCGYDNSFNPTCTPA